MTSSQLSQISEITDGIPWLCGLLFYQRMPSWLKPFFYFLCFVVLQDAFTVSLVKMYGYNMWWSNSYAFIETLFYSILFHRWLFGKKGNVVLILLLVIFSMLWFYTNFFIYLRMEANNLSRVVASLLVMLYSMQVLIKVSRQTSEVLFRNPQFWIASGTLWYFTFTLLVFSIFPFMTSNHFIPEITVPVMNVLSLVNIFSNLLFAIAFLCPPKTLKYPPPKLFSHLPPL